MLWSNSSKFRAGLFVLYSSKPPRCITKFRQACLYYIEANHLTASSPTCGHALLQIAVYLQHSTLLIDLLELPESGSGRTTYLCVAVAVPSCDPSAFARCTGPLAASVGSRLPFEALLVEQCRPFVHTVFDATATFEESRALHTNP
jgi:hypothetical protein